MAVCLIMIFRNPSGHWECTSQALCSSRYASWQPACVLGPGQTFWWRNGHCAKYEGVGRGGHGQYTMSEQGANKRNDDTYPAHLKGKVASYTNTLPSKYYDYVTGIKSTLARWGREGRAGGGLGVGAGVDVVGWVGWFGRWCDSVV
jgi:hypothetical protein